MERNSGVLLHISSLPNEQGIGTFGKTAYEFVDFLVETGQKYWQILPLTTTSFGDSPYQSFSAFAGNTHFIDFDVLVEDGLLDESDLLGYDFGDNPVKVDYAKVFNQRRPVLDKAVNNFIEQKGLRKSSFKTFMKENEEWLIPYVEYMTVKENNDLNPWYEWPEKYRHYDKEFIQEFCDTQEELYNYHLVTQYWFFKQWMRLKKYANENHIEIIGDIPIYVSRDSVEMWQTPELFVVDKDNNPKSVAGVPPDTFSDDGQYWGNPIYDWEYMYKTDYEWWVWRMEESFRLYDVVRIDHFRGFESYWDIPYGSATAATGEWKLGPGIRLFKQIKKDLGNLNIIAEDLGFITPEVNEMREATGFPGMKILINGFAVDEDSTDLPHHYHPNTIAYVGTHDNPSGLDWYLNHANQEQRDQADVYFNRRPGEHISDALNRGIAASPSSIAIYTMQDLLHLGAEGRMNRPSTIGDNWDWRFKPGAITNDITEKLLAWTKSYFRYNDKILAEKNNDPLSETEKLSLESSDQLEKEFNEN